MYIQVNREKDTPILIEVLGSQIGEENVSGFTNGVRKTEMKLQEVINGIKPITESIVSSIDTLAQKPNEMEVEFTVKLSATGKMVIVEANSEFLFKIVLKWKK
jgi:hypothetical protein